MGMREFLACVLRLWLFVQEATTVNIIIHPKNRAVAIRRCVRQVLSFARRNAEKNPFLKKHEETVFLNCWASVFFLFSVPRLLGSSETASWFPRRFGVFWKKASEQHVFRKSIAA